jgi:hypothetical protein
VGLISKKAQIGNVLYSIMFVFTVGFVLFHLQPTIDAVRLEQIANINNDQIIARMVLYGLLPIIWFMYLILSIIAVYLTIRISGGGI